jgi:hypothetical protein
MVIIDSFELFHGFVKLKNNNLRSNIMFHMKHFYKIKGKEWLETLPNIIEQPSKSSYMLIFPILVWKTVLSFSSTGLILGELHFGQ